LSISRADGCFPLDVLAGELGGFEEAGALVQDLSRAVHRVVRDLVDAVHRLTRRRGLDDRFELLVGVELDAVLLGKGLRAFIAGDVRLRDDDLSQQPLWMLVLFGEDLRELFAAEVSLLHQHPAEGPPLPTLVRRGRRRRRPHVESDAVLLGEYAYQRGGIEEAPPDEHLAE
jgi:hypothetical protein